MNEKAPTTSPLTSRENLADEIEEPLVSPQFLDRSVIENARPAVPLSEIKRRRSWPTHLIIAALLFGLAVGAFGGMLLIRERSVSRQATSTAQPATPQAATESTNAEMPAPAVSKDEVAVNKTSSPQAEKIDRQRASESANENVEARQEAREMGKPEIGVVPGDDDAKALRGALNEWVSATNRRDIDKQMSFYNPTVNAFYLSRNASRETVRAEKNRVFSRASSIDIRAANPQIRVSPDGSTATMRFRKNYAIEGGGQDKRGAVVQELQWKRVNGVWKIVSERDVKVLSQ